jgi:benzoyl-CoA reductase/2-hydroxyglutaryl-CoA dehydratase subunit BcrC/BadD/HgdB
MSGGRAIDNEDTANPETDSSCPPCVTARRDEVPRENPLAWFADMIDHCLEYAERSKAEGRHIVGILCEYTPRELIMAAGGVPVCLCGGSAKTIPAAEEDLPANLCPLIKSTYGYHRLKSNPFLEMADLIVAETTCDGKKKMYELMGQTRPMYVLELPQKENDFEAFEHWLSELRKFKSALESRWGVSITEDKIRQAIAIMNRERALRRALAELMKLDEPPLTGRQLLDLKSIISGIPADFAQYEAALKLYGPAGREGGAAKDAIQKGESRDSNPDLSAPPADLPAARPRRPATRPVRVLMTGVPIVHGAERVLEIVEGSGGLVVCQENCTGVKPILEDIDSAAADPLRALAEKYFRIPCSVKTPNEGRLESLGRLANEYRAECIIELIWQACLTYDVESLRVKRLAEQKLKLPYLRIETDYSPSDSARIAVRVEALFEMVRGRR